MFLLEPPRTPYDLNFSVAGIPVRVHPFFWIVGILLGARDPAPESLLTWMVVFFVSILVHELGHALAIIYYGWRPWVLLYGFGGMAMYQPGFTSSHSSYSRSGNTPLGQIVIAAAGPAAGFTLAALTVASLYLTSRSVDIYFPFFPAQLGMGTPLESGPAERLVQGLIFINVFWSILNLFPIYPLDGGKIAREILVALNPSDGVRQSLILSICAGGGLALFAIQLGSIFMAVMFGYLAYSSYNMLQGPGGGFGGGGFGGGGFGGGRRSW